VRDPRHATPLHGTFSSVFPSDHLDMQVEVSVTPGAAARRA